MEAVIAIVFLVVLGFIAFCVFDQVFGRKL
jgi:type II secretory pathway component PulJ